jgi:hypothetical protein
MQQTHLGRSRAAVCAAASSALLTWQSVVSPPLLLSHQRALVRRAQSSSSLESSPRCLRATSWRWRLALPLPLPAWARKIGRAWTSSKHIGPWIRSLSPSNEATKQPGNGSAPTRECRLGFFVQSGMVFLVGPAHRLHAAWPVRCFFNKTGGVRWHVLYVYSYAAFNYFTVCIGPPVSRQFWASPGLA